MWVTYYWIWLLPVWVLLLESSIWHEDLLINSKHILIKYSPAFCTSKLTFLWTFLPSQNTRKNNPKAPVTQISFFFFSHFEISTCIYGLNVSYLFRSNSLSLFFFFPIKQSIKIIWRYLSNNVFSLHSLSAYCRHS